MARITSKRIDGESKHLAPNSGEGDYLLKMDNYPPVPDRPRLGLVDVTFTQESMWTETSCQEAEDREIL